MGLMNTIRNALGLRKALKPLDPAQGLRIDSSARAYLATLPAGQGLHLVTRPAEWGSVVQVQEGELQGPPPPELGDLPISVSNDDLHLLRGLILERKEDRWAVSVDLELRGRETPNPSHRQYLTNRMLSVGRPLYFNPGVASNPLLANRILSVDGVLSILLRGFSLTVEREGESDWDTIDQGIDAALREYFLRCGHQVDTADLPSRADPLENEVMRVLEETILPGIHQDGGDLQLVSIEDGVVRVSMHGACKSCPASTATLKLGVERTLQQAFPGQIHAVEQV
ncbi:MAG: hypothetical protein GWP91_03550 [Rhodobacterales bacterium]|nr:hypothetical protein [Rhodobacterales bacterium]